MLNPLLTVSSVNCKLLSGYCTLPSILRTGLFCLYQNNDFKLPFVVRLSKSRESESYP